MEYTTSDANVVHAGTGNRMHQDTLPVTTVVSAKDMNMVVWSLMKLLADAGITAATFDPATPATYNRVSLAVAALSGASVPAPVNFTPVLSFGGASTGITYVVQQGQSFTQGKKVTFWAFIQLSSKGSATGNANVVLGSLGNAAANFPAQLLVDQMASLSFPPTGLLITGTNRVEVRLFNGSSSQSPVATDANFTNTTQFYITGSYLLP